MSYHFLIIILFLITFHRCDMRINDKGTTQIDSLTPYIGEYYQVICDLYSMFFLRNLYIW
jgi:hypothetical protein